MWKKCGEEALYNSNNYGKYFLETEFGNAKSDT